MAEDVQVISGHFSNPKIAARLSNFASGSAALLATHKAWLDANVAPILRFRTTWVNLYAYASKLGTPAANEAMSTSRLKSVRSHVSAYADHVTFKEEKPKGETESLGDEKTDDGPINAYWRAVEVFVYEFKPPPFTRIPEPIAIVNVRRIIHRYFMKIKAEMNMNTDPADAQNKEMLDALMEALTGNRQPRTIQFMGDEVLEARRYASFPSSYRVNRVIYDTDETFETTSFGSVATSGTAIDYEWQMSPLPFVEVINKYQITVNDEKRPATFRSNFIPRRQAERSALIIPPNP
jgi:hypothetical protein